MFAGTFLQVMACYSKNKSKRTPPQRSSAVLEMAKNRWQRKRRAGEEEERVASKEEDKRRGSNEEGRSHHK